MVARVHQASPDRVNRAGSGWWMREDFYTAPMNSHTPSSHTLTSNFEVVLPPPPVVADAAAGPTDEALMEAIQRQDASALETFIQRYRRLCKTAILRTISDDTAAEDVLQECFLELWRHAGHYDPAKGRPLAWLMVLCRRRAIDHVRRSQVYCRVKDRMEEECRNTDAVIQDANADNEQADVCRLLNEHLDALPESQSHVIRLAFLKGMTQREVAAYTQQPLGTVKTRMELGLRKLRASLQRSHINALEAA
jgi:RNA polymerase sigma-70 factor (ECF subfamily)